MDDPKLVELTKKYSKTGAQILLRWGLQKVRDVQKQRLLGSTNET